MKTFMAGSFLWIAVIIAMAAGWIMNIIDLINMPAGITGLFVARVAGIFIPPLGAILGLFV
jgi:hypothetical protein